MTLLKIAQVGHPVLRQETQILTQEELSAEGTQSFIDDLIETMRDANGAGLAAPQVYTPLQICALEVRANNPRYPYKPKIPLTVVVNPKLTLLTEERFLNYEGCLSVPDLRAEVPRCPHVKVEYWTRDGEEICIEAKGITAGTWQHEIDHLFGKLFLDRVENAASFSTWKNFDTHHKDAFNERANAVVEKYGS
ncbi:MAG: peptide deformylase [Deltaproteobacteria bacterium]|nr:peptide deformylase [Deltaproteobacteria bacterium]